MVSVPELRDVHPKAFSDAATAWRGHADALLNSTTDLDKQVRALDDWAGRAVDAAEVQVQRSRKRLAETADRISRISPILLTLADRIEVARNKLRSALAEAAEFEIDVATTGSHA